MSNFINDILDLLGMWLNQLILFEVFTSGFSQLLFILSSILLLMAPMWFFARLIRRQSTRPGKVSLWSLTVMKAELSVGMFILSSRSWVRTIFAASAITFSMLDLLAFLQSLVMFSDIFFIQSDRLLKKTSDFSLDYLISILKFYF